MSQRPGQHETRRLLHVKNRVADHKLACSLPVYDIAHWTIYRTSCASGNDSRFVRVRAERERSDEKLRFQAREGAPRRVEDDRDCEDRARGSTTARVRVRRAGVGQRAIPVVGTRDLDGSCAMDGHVDSHHGSRCPRPPRNDGGGRFRPEPTIPLSRASRCTDSALASERMHKRVGTVGAEQVGRSARVSLGRRERLRRRGARPAFL
ncbi:hypothetical protein [Sorangium sp. So ce1182]|uniref:hypothetical protein n=1 Tax=Sorangium sp. So ce1182 TaxID=3133334 RepID=UPI003F614FF9